MGIVYRRQGDATVTRSPYFFALLVLPLLAAGCQKQTEYERGVEVFSKKDYDLAIT